MGGLCCRQKESQERYNAQEMSLHDLASDAAENEGLKYHQVDHVHGRKYNSDPYAPSLDEEPEQEIAIVENNVDTQSLDTVSSTDPTSDISDVNSDGLGERTKTGTSDGEVNEKRSALFCAAIDFGTTYTGFAFSSRDKQKQVFTMATKKGSSKVPTVVLFDQNKKFHSFGYKAEKKYEKLLSCDNHREWYLFKEFKMKLFQSKELTKNTQVKDFEGKKEMPAIDIFAYAIKCIIQKLLKDILKKKSGIRKSDIHWVLTVPAIWNDSAKQFMRRAAIRAGISDEMLTIALEPEAASVYCREVFPYVAHLETRYILLDIGGGTMDTTCHRVVDGGLKEIHKPHGGGFGGTDVEKTFIKVLIDMFGKIAVERFKDKFLKEFWELLADFEMSKRKFDGKGKLVINFPARLGEIYCEQENKKDAFPKFPKGIEIKRGKMSLSKEKGRWIFDETITRVIEQTQVLLKALGNVDYIVLVGGFSESEYLQTRMKDTFGDKVVSPAEPRTAVMRGSVLFGQSPASIQTRVSKYTYGIATTDPFKPGIHSEVNKIDIDGYAYCDHIFKKHVTIGQEITVGQNMKENTYHPIVNNQAYAVLQVFASSKENPKYVTDEGCQQVGLLFVEIDTGGNRNFKIKVQLIFGGTEIQVKVFDGHGILIKDTRIDFLV